MLEETFPLLGEQQKTTRWLPIYWLSAVVFFLSTAGSMQNVPLTRLIEDNLCSRYVQGTPTEELCKTDEIQSKLAYLNGCLPLVEAVVGACDEASAFFLMAFASLVGGSLGPAVSSIFMERFSPWVAVLISFFTTLVSLIPFFVLPETLPPPEQNRNSEQDDLETEERHHSLRSHLSQSLHLLNSSIASLKSPSIILVLATFLTAAPEALGTAQFLAQYISRRFDWPLARTGYLLTLRGIIHMGVLLFALPLLSDLLLRYQRPPVKDLTLARVSVAIAAVGALCMAASQIGLVVAGLAIHSLGSGLAPLCRSLAISYVSAQDTSKLNVVIGIVETTGLVFAGPALAWSFETGMKLGGMWFGLPYYGLAGSFALCLVGLVFVHPPAQEAEIEEF
ncbi:hypothetical protein F1880_004354 [Penicillium rolfsii]|nr:hypothetical protein F1880_004354 [Penicillium rolfsii]